MPCSHITGQFDQDEAPSPLLQGARECKGCGRRPSRCRSAIPPRLARSTMSNSAPRSRRECFSWSSLPSPIHRKEEKEAERRQTQNQPPHLTVRRRSSGSGTPTGVPPRHSRQRPNATAQLQLTRFLGRKPTQRWALPIPCRLQCSAPGVFAYHLRCRRRGRRPVDRKSVV